MWHVRGGQAGQDARAALAPDNSLSSWRQGFHLPNGEKLHAAGFDNLLDMFALSAHHVPWALLPRRSPHLDEDNVP